MRWHRLIVVVTLVVVGNCWWLPTAMAGKRLALVVAANYTASNRREKPKPGLTTEKDGSQLRYVLSAAGYEVTLLSDTEATRTGREQDRPRYETILNHVKRITTDGALDDSSSVIIVFAGPAYSLWRDKVKQERVIVENLPPKKLFLEAADSPARGLFAGPLNAEDVKAADKLLDVEAVWDQMSKSPASSKFMILDVCRNVPGENHLSLGYATTFPPLLSAPAGVAVLCSCSLGQSSIDEPRYLGSGIFMHHVLCGLHGAADGTSVDAKADDAISIPELAAYVRDHVRNHVSLQYSGKPLAPDARSNFDPQLLGSCQTEIPLLKVDRSLLGKKAGNERTFSLSDAVKIKMVWCPPGTFLRGKPPIVIGSKDERKDATLTLGFWLGETEVTQAEWKAVMGTEPWLTGSDKKLFRVGPKYPALYITHQQALEFCSKVTDLQHTKGALPMNWEFRLPSDAQWEYACYAGTKTKWSFGDDKYQLAKYAWVLENNEREAYARPVRQKLPNPWGLYDMYANVAEWTADTDSSSLITTGGYDPIRFQPPPHYGNQWRVARGGDVYSGCDGSFHTFMTEPEASPWIGLRVGLCPIAH